MFARSQGLLLAGQRLSERLGPCRGVKPRGYCLERATGTRRPDAHKVPPECENKTVSTPTSEAELLQRADSLVGATVGQLADSLGRTAPPDLRRHKGFVGQLVEQALGAVAGSRSEPDFPHLGIELKTVPVDAFGRPAQSTWVCTAPVGALDPPPWWTSPVRGRLARVLWVPVCDRGPLPERRFRVPVLWSPTAQQEETLLADYTCLTELLAEGEVWQWTARHGAALQLRPKAATSRDRIEVTDAEGDLVETVPLGFYLRRSFTAAILQSS